MHHPHLITSPSPPVGDIGAGDRDLNHVPPTAGSRLVDRFIVNKEASGPLWFVACMGKFNAGFVFSVLWEERKHICRVSRRRLERKQFNVW